jgi:hypothetical protein
MMLYKVTIEENPADIREVLMSAYELVRELQKRPGCSHDEALTEFYFAGEASYLRINEGDEWSLSWIEQ